MEQPLQSPLPSPEPQAEILSVPPLAPYTGACLSVDTLKTVISGLTERYRQTPEAVLPQYHAIYDAFDDLRALMFDMAGEKQP